MPMAQGFWPSCLTPAPPPPLGECFRGQVCRHRNERKFIHCDKLYYTDSERKRVRPYSIGWKPVDLMRGVQVSESDLIIAARAAGVEPWGTMPVWA
jgi:hypothetical protein